MNPKCPDCGTRLVHHHSEFYGSEGDYVREQYFVCPKCFVGDSGIK